MKAKKKEREREREKARMYLALGQSTDAFKSSKKKKLAPNFAYYINHMLK
jgi:hypothetical protein